ncbi:hypothetical protein BEWA_041650 [Theileria equi strain WA]|uniref:Uncharacterized protein n=1 Tax=Theileria equi strain WA TaxID=1537102 RepID=L1LFB3_THEEQ|nr:hypothetical protein BEWA_041650 [Theileria equi strain WA]EKX74127.1 hypothetical protein BEWA_041650 [Theileria equi strain WA]|eukprot:XP_004833579.1 hypothetical protein BEWA_041650 [Theileria equi strain WA]
MDIFAEQINRIKKQLNESHETVTLTKQLVEKYLDSLNWISTRMPWSDALFWNDDSVTLDLDEKEEQPPLEEKVQECANDANGTLDGTFYTPCTNWIGAVNAFSRETAHGLANLLTEIKGTRTKTSLLSKVITEQSKSLEQISSSAQALQERIVNVNNMLNSKS